MSLLQLDLTLPLARFELRVRARLGEAVAILGPSGAGKSSLVESIAGLRPARGRIVIDGEVVLDDGAGVRLPPERRRVGWVPQDGAVFPHLSVRRNVTFGRPATAQRDVEEVVDALELGPLLDRSSLHLSGGERRRVALARALCAEPRLLLLDEPTAGLDAARARRALRHVREVRQRFGTPLLLVTHREDEALALASEVLLLDEGRVVDAGRARDVLRAKPPTGVDAHGVNVLAGSVLGHDADGGVTRVRLETGDEISVPLQAGLAVDADVVLAVDAEDVLVSTSPPHDLSARNALEVELTRLVSGDGAVLVEAGPWRALLTAAAARDLALAPGRRAWLVVKTHGWRVVAG